MSETGGKPKGARRWLARRLAQILWAGLCIYLMAYALNSHLGGYWLELARDGKDRFAPDLGGLALTDAVMWQPRLGRCSLGNADSLGLVFLPLIQMDQAWPHPTHYLSDTNFDVWLQGLPPSKVHPRFRADFLKQSGKRRANSGSALAPGVQCWAE